MERGAGPCPAPPIVSSCRAGAMLLRSPRQPGERRENFVTVQDRGFPGTDLKGCHPHCEPQPRRFSLLGERQQLERFLLSASDQTHAEREFLSIVSREFRERKKGKRTKQKESTPTKLVSKRYSLNSFLFAF